jgi:hypothetical protein
MIEGQERADRCNLILPNCKYGRHPARSFDAHDQTLPILPRLRAMREETALPAVSSVRLWHWASAARPLLGLFSRLSGPSRAHPLVCPVCHSLGRCGGAPAGSTRANQRTRECGARLAPKLWYPQSRSASARKSERSHTRAAFPLQGGKVEAWKRRSEPPVL